MTDHIRPTYTTHPGSQLASFPHTIGVSPSLATCRLWLSLRMAVAQTPQLLPRSKVFFSSFGPCPMTWWIPHWTCCRADRRNRPPLCSARRSVLYVAYISPPQLGRSPLCIALLWHRLDERNSLPKARPAHVGTTQNVSRPFPWQCAFRGHDVDSRIVGTGGTPARRTIVRNHTICTAGTCCTVPGSYGTTQH